MTSQGSQTLTLNCLTYGAPFSEIFDVSIGINSKVTELRRAICEEAKEGWLPQHVMLWQVSILEDENVDKTLKKLKLEESEMMKTTWSLFKYFKSSPPQPEHIHIIVKLSKRAGQPPTTGRFQEQESERNLLQLTLEELGDGCGLDHRMTIRDVISEWKEMKGIETHEPSESPRRLEHAEGDVPSALLAARYTMFRQKSDEGGLRVTLLPRYVDPISLMWVEQRESVHVRKRKVLRKGLTHENVSSQTRRTRDPAMHPTLLKEKLQSRHSIKGSRCADLCKFVALQVAANRL
ncbi:hypothetical protein FRC03_002044 [Tulasnella sp. 419]|nr:hypothetical protein FRC03_002044 [Tulasnella sp. 419]